MNVNKLQIKYINEYLSTFTAAETTNKIFHCIESRCQYLHELQVCVDKIQLTERFKED